MSAGKNCPEIAPTLPDEPPPDEATTRLVAELGPVPWVLYAGHFLPNKGVEILLRAFVPLTEKGQLVLAWSGLGDIIGVRKPHPPPGAGIAGADFGAARSIAALFFRTRARWHCPSRSPSVRCRRLFLVVEAFRAGSPVIVPAVPSVSLLGLPTEKRVSFFRPEGRIAFAGKNRPGADGRRVGRTNTDRSNAPCSGNAAPTFVRRACMSSVVGEGHEQTRVLHPPDGGLLRPTTTNGCVRTAGRWTHRIELDPRSAAYLTPKSAVIELACGTGRLLKASSGKRDGTSPASTSRKRCSRRAELLGTAQVQVGDVFHLPLPDAARRWRLLLSVHKPLS